KQALGLVLIMEENRELRSSCGPALDNVPPEIIIAILEDLTSLAGLNPLGKKYGDLVRFTHVSARLRKVAISSPTLWTRVDITDRPATFELAKACLQRSGIQELDVSICITNRFAAKISGVTTFIDHAANRTRSLALALRLSKDSQWQQFNDVLRNLASTSLIKLNLEILNSDELIRRHSFRFQAVFLPTQTSNLTSLTLRNCVPDFEGNSNNQLRHLSIGFHEPCQLPQDHLQNTLCGYTSLETLEITVVLQSVWFSSANRPPDRSTRVCLPNLLLLRAKGYRYDDLSQLFLDLDAPRLKQVELALASTSYALHDPSVFVGLFPSVHLLGLAFLPKPTSSLYTRLWLNLPKTFPNVEELALSSNGWQFLAMPEANSALLAKSSWIVH
ncbi:hypothetical protein FRB90_008149, partial [Tulasnella sp. 427]